MGRAILTATCCDNENLMTYLRVIAPFKEVWQAYSTEASNERVGRHGSAPIHPSSSHVVHQLLAKVMHCVVEWELALPGPY